jgi:hypothetical protein
MNRKEVPVKRAWGRRGATQVVVAVALPVLLGFGALTVDIGRLMVEKQRLSHLCDAAAKAGGLDLPTSPTVLDQAAARSAERIAEQYARANSRGIANLTITTQAKPAPTGYRLEVTAKEEVPMAFARIFGIHTRSVQARAVAEREAAPGWVPIAIEKRKIGWGAIALSQCAVGQWWVTSANGVEVNCARDFQNGASTALDLDSKIELSRVGEQHQAEIIAATEQRVASGRNEVRVLLIDGAVNHSGLPVGDALAGSARFQTYATVQLSVQKDSAGRKVALGIKWLDQGAGPLNAGDSASSGRVRLVE